MDDGILLSLRNLVCPQLHQKLQLVTFPQYFHAISPLPYLPIDWTHAWQQDAIQQVVDDLQAESHNIQAQIDTLNASRKSLQSVMDHKKASVNPIRRLPIELLARIFEIYFENENRPNILISVSRLWRSTLHNMPRLWSMVACKTYTKDEIGYIDPMWPDYAAYRLCTTEDRLESILTRCKGAPIELVVDLTPSNNVAATPPSMILRITPDRVKNVRSLLAQQVPENFCDIVPNALTGSWDLLKEAQLYVHIPSLMKSLSLSAPKLHILTVSAGVPIGEYSTAPFWKQITRLTLYGPVESPAAVSACLCASEVLTYLNMDMVYLGGKPLTKSPVLEELHIYGSQLDLAKNTYPTLKTASISSIDPPTNKVDFPAITSLRYYNGDLATLAKLRAPALCDLDISGVNFENAAADDIHTVWSLDVRKYLTPRHLRLSNLSCSVPKLVGALRVLSPYLESLCLTTPSCTQPCLWRALLPLPAHRAEAQKEKGKSAIALLPKVSDLEIYTWDQNSSDRRRGLVLDQLVEVARARNEAGCGFAKFQIGLAWEWHRGCAIQLNSQAEKRTIWGRDRSKAQTDWEAREAEQEKERKAAAEQTQKALETFSSRAGILTDFLRRLEYGSLFQVGVKDTRPSVPSAEVAAAEAAAQDALRQWLEDWL